jgi:iron complex transport system substrate-binding protein
MHSDIAGPRNPDSARPTGEPTLRIASLLASATEIVAALGVSDRLVAISHECDYPTHVLDRPRASRPVFQPAGLDSGEIDGAVRRAILEHGAVYAVDGELLAHVDPTLILTQAVCNVCAVPTAGVQEVVAERGLHAEVLSLDAHTIDGILDSIVIVGAAVGLEPQAKRLTTALRERIARVRRAVAGRSQPRVLAIEWLDPPFVPGHWVPEMIRIAGGANLAGETGQRSRETSWDALAELDPDVLLVMPCGYDLETARSDADRHGARLERVGAQAIAAGHAFVVNGSAYFNRSGPRVIDGIEMLAALFHPDLFVLQPGRAAVWP